MVTQAPSPELHPADQVHAERLARVLAQLPRNGGREDAAPLCDHGRGIGDCRTCIELRHAEVTSVTLRSWFAWGMVPTLEARS
jgi:hypothetical protein